MNAKWCKHCGYSIICYNDCGTCVACYGYASYLCSSAKKRITEKFDENGKLIERITEDI